MSAIDVTASLTETNQTYNDFVLEDYKQRVVITVIGVAVFFVGITGNSVVILAVILSRRLRSPTNCFVVNLAFADFVTCLCLPFNGVSMLSRRGWLLPEWICAVAGGVINTCVGASIATLSLIAFNRWYLLTQSVASFQKLYQWRNTIIMAMFAWFYAFLINITPAFFGIGQLGYSPNYKTCSHDTTHSGADTYELIQGVGMFAIPTIAIATMYIRIYIFVTQHNRKMISISKSTNNCSACLHEEAGVQRGLDSSRLSYDAHLSTNRMSEPVHAGRNSCDIKSAKVVDILDTDTSTVQADPMTGDSSSKIATSQTSPDSDSSVSSGLIEPETHASFTDQTLAHSIPLNCKRKWKLKVSQGASTSINYQHVAVTKRMALIVCVFFACYFPIIICSLVPGGSLDPAIPWIELLIVLNSCLNPLIYAKTMPAFRKVMHCILLCKLDKIPEPATFLQSMRTLYRPHISH